jgi:hypothetical protein
MTMFLFHSDEVLALSSDSTGKNLPDLASAWKMSDDSNDLMFIYGWEQYDFAELHRELKIHGFCILCQAPSRTLHPPLRSLNTTRIAPLRSFHISVH